jgi:hypothetical protein
VVCVAFDRVSVNRSKVGRRSPSFASICSENQRTRAPICQSNHKAKDLNDAVRTSYVRGTLQCEVYTSSKNKTGRALGETVSLGGARIAIKELTANGIRMEIHFQICR